MNADSEISRQNKIALLGNVVAAIVFTITFVAEFINEGRAIWYPVCGVILAWLPVISSAYFWKKDTETAMIKHIIAVGFAVVYSYSIFLTKNSASYAFVFPMILIVCVFSDLSYMKKIIFGVVLENVITCVAQLVTKSAFGYVSDGNSSMQLMAVLAGAVASLVVMNALEVNAKEKVEDMASEKSQTEKALTKVTRMTDKMNISINEINAATDHLLSAATATHAAMDGVSTGAGETADAVQKQLVKTEEIQNKIEVISKEATTVADNMNETMGVLETGKDDMETLVKNVEDSVNLGKDVTEKLETLDEYIEKMHTIIGIIGEITSQTSLLALNASIEAARAGEAGKGFAVVAGEITNMASQTQDATTNITELIDGVSNAINQVVSTVRNMITGINDQKGAAENTVKSFKTIETNTYAIRESIDSLESGVKVLEESNKEITEYIEKISAISQEVTARANETLDLENSNAEDIGHISDMVSELSELSNEI